MLQKNQIIELVIDDIANDGSGVGRADGLAVFVPNTAVGDRISAKIVKATPRLAYGAVQELLSPGPDAAKMPAPDALSATAAEAARCAI